MQPGNQSPQIGDSLHLQIIPDLYQDPQLESLNWAFDLPLSEDWW
jgi:hypothetical protein